MKADLHCHSRISDGSLSVKELVQLAKSLGIGAIAITEHDTIKLSSKAYAYGSEAGVTIINGVEISAFDYKRNKKAHVLGYLIDAPEMINEKCSSMLAEREKISKWIINRLAGVGYPISWELVSGLAKGSTNVYKQHIMNALMEMGYTNSIHGELYKSIFAKPYGIAYKEMEYMNVYDAVEIIKKAGGVAVLAHPAGYDNMELIPELAALGLDGIEASHPSHSTNDVNEIIKLGFKLGLILTGGSDFHGMYDERINPLGSCYIKEDQLNMLFERKARTLCAI